MTVRCSCAKELDAHIVRARFRAQVRCETLLVNEAGRLFYLPLPLRVELFEPERAQSPRLETPGYWGSYRGTTPQATSGKRLYGRCALSSTLAAAQRPYVESRVGAAPAPRSGTRLYGRCAAARVRDKAQRPWRRLPDVAWDVVPR